MPVRSKVIGEIEQIHSDLSIAAATGATTLRSMKTYEGACHCGRVRFRVTTELERVVQCNCSICSLKGFLHLIVEPRSFELVSGADSLTSYRFNTGVAEHKFCRHCGIHPFYTPRSDPDKVDVNARCLEGVDLATLAVDTFDGKNWETAISNAPWKQARAADPRKILEVAILNLRPGLEAEFEAAFRQAEALIAVMPGYGGHELRRCLEHSGRYVLLVHWDSLESHTVEFRGSPEYREWKALLHGFYEPFPCVEHYVALDAQERFAGG
jgi:heme-degrading monooxygenase HmoA